MTSETSKYRHLTMPYCQGSGLDIGSGGDPVVPWAIQVDLPVDQYASYNAGHERGYIHLTCPVDNLALREMTMDFVYSSHLLEDFERDRWPDIVNEWCRVLRPKGHLVILVPDALRWAEAIRWGQPPNCAHRHEAHVGELTLLMREIPISMNVVQDDFTNCSLGPHGIDYSILFVAKRR